MEGPETSDALPDPPSSSWNAHLPPSPATVPQPSQEELLLLPAPSTLASNSNPAPNNESSLEPPHVDVRSALRSPARARTPISTTTSPLPTTPHGMPAGNADGTPLLGPAVPRSPDSNRPLNVTDALSYLDAVKMQFHDKPDVYNHFLDIMKDFKSQVIDTPGVIERVSMLFHGNPYLIQGFNTFLPPGYRIELSTDSRNMDTILVTTPGGTTSHKLSTFGADMRGSRDAMISGTSVPSPDGQPPFGLPPPPVLPVGIGSGSRPVTPNSHFPTLADMQYAGQQGAQTTAAASFLGNLSNMSNRAMEKTPGEFNHAIQYLNKIKERFADSDAVTYKQFLDILQTYQKEQKHLHDSQVYVQVQMLFKDAPDLMDEFRDFLPNVGGSSSHNAGEIRGILPNPATSSGAWAQTDAPAPEKATKAPSRRRKRPAGKDAADSSKAGGRSAKRARTNQKPEPQSPKFSSPFLVPTTPPPAHPHGHSQSGGAPHPLQPSNVVQVGGSSTTPEELLFFDRTKKALENNASYDEFIKLLNLFAAQIITMKTLVEHAESFLDIELMGQFKELLGWDDKQGKPEFGPPGSIRTGPPDPAVERVDRGQGPSYRRLPDSEIRLACSGRDQLCWSVLNDGWVSHPTWASEEAGFVAHKKNTHEDLLSKSEEERHEFQVHIEALSRTIALLEPLDARIEEMSADERAQFRLLPDLGGPSRTIYERIIKKVYGRDAGNEVMRALQENPSITVPVVLTRLRQKDEDWRRSQREWNRTWRDVEAKNFYKALDHQSASFKTNDKKLITTKHFVLDIEGVKESQTSARDGTGDKAFACGSVGPQYEFQFEDTLVLQDSVKLIYHFIDHSPSVYSHAERRSVEGFLGVFIPVLFMFQPHDFNAAYGPLSVGHEEDTAGDSLAAGDGADEGTKTSRDRSGKRQTSGGQSTAVSAGALRKRLLKTAQERSPRTKLKELPSRSAALTRSASPAASESPSGATRPKGSRLNQELGVDDDEPLRSNPEDIWIREFVTSAGAVKTGETPITRRPFFANTTFYALLRLVQVLYSRLLACKEIGVREAAQKHASLLANPVAVQLGLDEPNGPTAILAQAMEAVGDSRTGGETNVLYLYLLDACEKVFENELDQATFEEHMRWFFGTKAYLVFTLDRVITAIVKQVQTVMADSKCQELWQLLQNARHSGVISTHDTIRYRREAERHAGSDDHLYRFDWNRESRTLGVQLVGAQDPSVEEDDSARGRWQEYVASYVMMHPTEWVPARAKSRPVFLKRSMMDAEKGDEVATEMGMGVQVRADTYQLVYEGGGEDVLFRWRGREEDAVLRGRAAARDEERRRRLGRWCL
ncbi:hypothetical protein B0H21DRAFT_720471 [Amylocystis lapponica]|nr:hypothetical protein B0H21DRAFT_720471 [Amylocystis lapponica]